jgi:predicted nucleic acid-binding protein
MEIVIDSNILFRTLISHGAIMPLVFDINLVLYAPTKLKEVFIKHKNELVSKSKLSEKYFDELSSLLFEAITFVPLHEYSSFIPQAKKLLGTHTKDEDFIALCLMKNLKLWTYEPLLFEIGFGISTKQLSSSLNEENLT